MSITIKQNEAPELKLPKFTVDDELHKKLNDYELTKLMNQHNFTLFLGMPKSGKSSLTIGFLQTKTMFKGVFHNIFLFCPPNSRASIKNDFWGKNLPEDQIYDDLTLETLGAAYNMAQVDGQEGFQSLIVIDDMQSALKNMDIQKLLLHMVSNRRHAKLSIWLLCQSYFTIPRMVRNSLTNLFVFKVSKNDMTEIFKEVIEMDFDKFTHVLENSFKKKHDFLFINRETKQLFINWDEIIYSEQV